MESSPKQACVEDELRSLTEFLLGVHGHEGWLENYMTSPKLVTIPAGRSSVGSQYTPDRSFDIVSDSLRGDCVRSWAARAAVIYHRSVRRVVATALMRGRSNVGRVWSERGISNWLLRK
jgi:hypothetical protein